jgi:hypothetical protein
MENGLMPLHWLISQRQTDIVIDKASAPRLPSEQEYRICSGLPEVESMSSQ